MDLKKIKGILDLDIPDKLKETYILATMADDDKVIPMILDILNLERDRNKSLITDSNAELSRALVVLKDSNLKYNKKIIVDPKWVSGEIIKHYQKWKGYIGCCFNIDELK
jgi:hypothetical protein